MVKILKNVLKWLLITIAGLLLIVIGSIVIQTISKPNEVPSIFGYKPFVVLSGSMETEIYTGDLVVVKKVDPNLLNERDIIAFRDERGYVVTHRIVGIEYKDNEKVFITKGDNNNTNDDGFVTFDKVEGIYVLKMKKVGNVIIVLQKPITLVIILSVILVFGILWIFIDKNKLSNSERKELERLRKEKEEKK
jgi:signal peptidase